jgi:hypothetical protein
MKSNLLLPVLLGTALLIVGCGRSHETVSTEPPPDPQANAPAGSQPGQVSAIGGYTRLQETPEPSADPAIAPAFSQPHQPIEGRVHPFMTSQLRIFIREKGRMPESFAEFANARMDSVPFPPEGMEYAIDYSSRQIKIVPSRR